MVFDRGMVSAENLASLEAETWTYVSAMDKDEIQKAAFFGIAVPEPASPEDYEQIMAVQEFLPINENAFLYYREFVVEDRRYILTFDVARFLAEHKAQLKKIANLKEWIDQKNQSLREAKKKRNQDLLERETANTLKRKKLNKWVEIIIEPHTYEVFNKRGQSRSVQTFQLTYTINIDALKKGQRLHGITCFITNLKAKAHTAPDIVQWYRRKNKVEEAFHEIKDHLELRPIYLTREQRVIAHVTICILAYFFYNDIERRLKESNLEISTEDALSLLKECQINRIAVKQTNQSWLSITEPSSQQKEILKILKCENIIEKNHLIPVLKKAEQWL
jgi:transposase